MFSLKEYREPQGDRLSDLLPWALFVAPSVIEQKDGLLQKTIEFRGPDLASCTREALIANAAKINNALKRLGGGWSLFVEARRVLSTSYPKSIWPNKACRLVDDERRKEFEREGAHFESVYYLTLVYAPPSERQSKITSWFFQQKGSDVGHTRLLEYFLEEIAKVTKLLKSVMPHVHELDDDETLTYLHSCVSTKQHLVKRPDIPAYLDAILCDQDIEHGLETKLGDQFLRTVTIRGFPGATFPGILDDLNGLECEYRWVSRYIAFSKEDARKELNKYRKRWYAKRKGLGSVIKEIAIQSDDGSLGNTDAFRKAEDSDHALQELEDDIVSFGHFTATVTVSGATREEADKKVRAIEAVINSKGFVTKLETLQSTEAWLGSLPGHVYANVWRPIVHSLNLAHMLPLSGIWSGSGNNTHLGGAPHMIVKTRGSTPFRLGLNVGDVGHTFIVGPTGAGKSTLLSFMALQWLRYDNAQVYIFDKGGSARAITHAVEGTYFVPGNADAPLSFQPLRYIDNEKERLWALEWLAELIELDGVQLKPALKEELSQALLAFATRPASDRTLTIFRHLLQDDGLKQSIAQYTLMGPYGQLLDACDDSLSIGRWQTFEMAQLMEKKGVVAPVLSYLFHRLEQHFTGAPTLLILDEAWRFLDHPLFEAKIREWLKELRKFKVYVIFATQNLSDAMNSRIAPVIRESCFTYIFLPNEAARAPDIMPFYRDMGLNDKQISIIANAVRKQEYYYSSPLGNRLFELGLGSTTLALCTASAREDHVLMDGILKAHEPDAFLDTFLREKRVGIT